MVDGDIFREIDEEMKRESFAKLWDKYGYLILGVALAVVLSVAGYKYWKFQQEEQAQTFGARYMDALDLASSGQKDLAQLSLSQIATDGPRGYAMLSKMRDAAVKASSGKLDEAASDYDKLASNKTVDPVFQDFSRIQAAMLRVDKADEAEMKTRLGKLAEGTSSWRHSARELLGLSSFRAGNMASAETYYSQVLSDRAAPAGLRQRAEMMLSLIVEATAEQSKDSAAAAKTSVIVNKAADKKSKK
ncbi:MAG: tetratricopeptide repeat protein [bacterium]|nr:tetratricopeptide repeat protein [bacterium]